MRLPLSSEHSALLREVGPFIREQKLAPNAPKGMAKKFERLMELNKAWAEEKKQLALMGEI